MSQNATVTFHENSPTVDIVEIPTPFPKLCKAWETCTQMLKKTNAKD